MLVIQRYPRLNAQQLQIEARRRETEERSRPPPSRHYNRKRPRGSGSDWFNCSRQSEPGQGSRGDDRETKKQKKPVARTILDGMDLDNPQEEK